MLSICDGTVRYKWKAPTLTTTALVTGASGGIGAEVARQLAATGVTVVVSARSVDRAKATAESIDNSVQVLPVGLDVADPESVQSAAAALAEEPGRLDILINNAAAYVDWAELASTADLDAARTVMEVNLFGGWRMTNALLPLLRRSEHPRVVHVSSGAGVTMMSSSGFASGTGLRLRTGSARQLSTRSPAPRRPSSPTRRSSSTPFAPG